MIFEIRVLELVRVVMLPKLRQKCQWVSHFGLVCVRDYGISANQQTQPLGWLPTYGSLQFSWKSIAVLSQRPRVRIPFKARNFLCLNLRFLELRLQLWR